jgi:LysM repeat protein
MAGNKKAIFDVGQENAKWVKELPGKVINCADLPIDKSLVQQINDEKVKLYIVQESPTHYNVSQVDKASFYQVFGNSIEFLASDADFVLHTDKLVSDVNLARPTSKMQVYLDGTLRMQCATAYILKKKESYSSENYKEYVLLPETGIVEKRSVANTGNTPDANALKLEKINKEDFKDVLSTICDKIQAALFDGGAAVPESYGNTSAVQPSGAALPTSYAGDPCAPSTIDGIHVVQKGETMYSISKRYGVTLDQLRAWNQLENTNVISLCQKLFVKAPAGGSTTNANVPNEKGGAAAGNQGYWVTAPEVHVVKAAETVASLANAYGYTEDRFRKMNGLGPTEGIAVGQRLRTSDCVCPTLASTTKDKPLPYQVEPEKIITAANKEDVYFRPVKIHEVKASETLFSIAKLYDSTIERLMELNDLKKGEGVKPGQRIYVQ